MKPTIVFIILYPKKETVPMNRLTERSCKPFGCLTKGLLLAAFLTAIAPKPGEAVSGLLQLVPA